MPCLFIMRRFFVYLALFFCASLCLYAQEEQVDPIVLFDVSATQDVNGDLPQHVLIRTLTQSYCKYFDFILRDGLIYAKAAGTSEWELFLKTGLPFSKSKKEKERFATPTAIREICADGDCLFAFDEQGIMYVCTIAKGSPDKPFIWRRLFGFPKIHYQRQNHLVVGKRGWSMGVRRGDILWYEDRYGNQHHYGTMGLETLYVLTEDGQHILFCDSGIPADFSHAIQGPVEGRFIAENISVSGDTLFLIGNQGTMYTRLIDFDTMGCDPMFFLYTYDRLDQASRGTDYISNYTAWALPAEDWARQSKIPLKGKARLTKMISIAQTGQGNGARELRVAGTDAEGRTGYYHKMLNAKAWTFVEAPLVLSEDVFLDASLSEIGKDTTFSYRGYVMKNDSKLTTYTCELTKAALSSEDRCLFRISSGTEQFSCTLYPVEKWTYVLRDNPGHDGTPKFYFLTAEFDEQSLKTYSAPFANLLVDIFKDKNHKLFAFSGEATTEYYQITVDGRGFASFFGSTPRQNEYTFFMTKDGSDDAHPFIYKGGQVFAQAGLPNPMSDDMLLPTKEYYTSEDSSNIRQKIEANKAFHALLQDEIKKYKEYEKTAGLSRWGYSFVDMLTRVTLLNKINFPKIKQVTSFGNNLMQTNQAQFKNSTVYTEWSYLPVLELIDLRIAAYTALLKDIASGVQEATLADNFCIDFIDYYRLVGLPLRAEQRSRNKKSGKTQTAQFAPLTDTSLFPWFILQIDDGTTVLIRLTDSARIITQRGANAALPSKTKPLRIPAVFSMVTVPDGGKHSPPDNENVIADINSYSGECTWDGERLKVYVTNAVFTKKCIFDGTPLTQDSASERE